jgi:hypothetical protein
VAADELDVMMIDGGLKPDVGTGSGACGKSMTISHNPALTRTVQHTATTLRLRPMTLREHEARSDRVLVVGPHRITSGGN